MAKKRFDIETDFFKDGTPFYIVKNQSLKSLQDNLYDNYYTTNNAMVVFFKECEEYPDNDEFILFDEYYFVKSYINSTSSKNQLEDLKRMIETRLENYGKGY